MAGRLQVAREFRPEECAPGCAAKRPNKNPRARLGLARQQFGKIGVGKLFRDAHTDSSVLDRREARFLELGLAARSFSKALGMPAALAIHASQEVTH